MKINKKQKQLDDVKTSILACKFCLKNAKGLLVPGEGNSQSKIVFVGEAPGKEEIKTGKPFIGRAGKVLSDLINSLGLETQNVFITSAVKYLPKTYVTPTDKDIEHGKIHLKAQLDVIKPRIVVVLGNTAAKSIFQRNFFIAKSHGELIENDNVAYFISYHPAAPLYSPKLREVIFEDFKKLKKIIKKDAKQNK